MELNLQKTILFLQEQEKLLQLQVFVQNKLQILLHLKLELVLLQKSRDKHFSILEKHL